MKRIDDFKDFLNEGYVDDNAFYSDEDVAPYKISEENAKILSDKAKEHGGVIGYNSSDADKYFSELGYEVRKIKASEVLKDKQILSDMLKRNVVNYVVSYLPEDDEMVIMGEEV